MVFMRQDSVDLHVRQVPQHEGEDAFVLELQGFKYQGRVCQRDRTPWLSIVRSRSWEAGPT